MILLKPILNEDFDILQHLRDRGVDPEKTEVIMDAENGMATFILYNLSGQLVGYQRYNPRGYKKDHDNTMTAKYYTYVTKEDNKTPKMAVWGVDNIDKDLPYLFITEGIFDAIKVKNAGYPVVAVLSNNPKHLKPWFAILHKRIIAIIQNDENKAGNALKKFADFWFAVPDGFNDLGDMSQEEASRFLKSVIKQLPDSDGKTHFFNDDGTIRNPKTGNDIKIRTALSYGPDHPAYREAQKYRQTHTSEKPHDY